MKLATTRIAIALATVFSLRYFYWRSLHTMNPAAKLFFYAFIIAEMMSFAESVLFYMIAWNPTHYARPEPVLGRTVDVFIPTYNEPLELLRETVLCAVNMRYPHLTYILDDGNREEVRLLAQEFGCGYITRKEHKYAKAGNLNHALAKTDGEFVVTLDADHVASPELIEDMIGFFANKRVAVVQATQDFYNLDSFQHNVNWTTKVGWQQQELFFSVIQPGKDRFNAAFYCGSPAMLRRKALKQIHGFSTETITEDMHTSLRLQKRGWRVLYVNRTVARGLAPQTFTGFATQWQRWGHGAMQVLRNERPFASRHLTLAQKLCYFSSFYFYWMSYQKLFFVCTPIIALFAGVFPLFTDPVSYANYFIPYFFLNLGCSVLLQGGVRNFLWGEQFNLLKIHVMMKTVTGLFQRESPFSVTPKARAAAATAAEVALPLSLMGALGAAMIVGIIRIRQVPFGYYYWALAVNIFWTFVFICLFGGVVRRSLQRKELRGTYRFPARLEVRMRVSYQNGTGEVVTKEDFARNLNRTGVSATFDEAIPQGTLLQLEMKLPERTVQALGKVMRNQSYEVNGRVKVSSGIKFERINVADQDEISKYLFWQIAPKEGKVLALTHTSQTEVLAQ